MAMSSFALKACLKTRAQDWPSKRIIAYFRQSGQEGIARPGAREGEDVEEHLEGVGARGKIRNQLPGAKLARRRAVPGTTPGTSVAVGPNVSRAPRSKLQT